MTMGTLPDWTTKASHSFCESVTAGPCTPWHIRPLDDAGIKPGGGATTRALCGRQVAWDVMVEIAPYHLENNTCPDCRKVYEERGKS